MRRGDTRGDRGCPGSPWVTRLRVEFWEQPANPHSCPSQQLLTRKFFLPFLEKLKMNVISAAWQRKLLGNSVLKIILSWQQKTALGEKKDWFLYLILNFQVNNTMSPLPTSCVQDHCDPSMYWGLQMFQLGGGGGCS